MKENNVSQEKHSDRVVLGISPRGNTEVHLNEAMGTGMQSSGKRIFQGKKEEEQRS